MTENKGPNGLPEAYEMDDLSRMRRVHDYLDHEFQEIPEHHHRREYGGSVPSVCERSPKPSSGRW
jgi:hypothetical protein